MEKTLEEKYSENIARMKEWWDKASSILDCTHEEELVDFSEEEDSGKKYVSFDAIGDCIFTLTQADIANAKFNEGNSEIIFADSDETVLEFGITSYRKLFAPKPRYVAYVEDGVLQGVFSDSESSDVDMLLVDADTQGDGEYGDGKYEIGLMNIDPISDMSEEIVEAIAEYDKEVESYG